jgi:hypothetical protein
MYEVDFSNLSPPTKAFRNIPSGEADESSAEMIEVLDPRHPLYGRCFRVIRRSAHRGGNFPPSYEVEHRHGSSLLIPVAVTEKRGLDANQTKLSIEALRDLVAVAECLDSHEYRPRRSLGDAVASPAASDRRRDGRDFGGGLS